jgi:hypothetical protein
MKGSRDQPTLQPPTPWVDGIRVRSGKVLVGGLENLEDGSVCPDITEPSTLFIFYMKGWTEF